MDGDHPQCYYVPFYRSLLPLLAEMAKLWEEHSGHINECIMVSLRLSHNCFHLWTSNILLKLKLYYCNSLKVHLRWEKKGQQLWKKCLASLGPFSNHLLFVPSLADHLPVVCMHRKAKRALSKLILLPEKPVDHFDKLHNDGESSRDLQSSKEAGRGGKLYKCVQTAARAIAWGRTDFMAQWICNFQMHWSNWHHKSMTTF